MGAEETLEYDLIRKRTMCSTPEKVDEGTLISVGVKT